MIKVKILFGGVCILLAFSAIAQRNPYIGFCYPAGAQQGTVAQIRLGGQNLDDPVKVYVSGEGVTGKLVDYHRALNNQELTLLREQLNQLRRSPRKAGKEAAQGSTIADQGDLMSKIQDRLANSVNRPASAALATLVFIELQVSPDAQPGQRELRLETTKGLSNPLYFHVGQLPEDTRKPMATAPLQVLGKEQLALRKRPPEEAARGVTLPCTVNGQVASGEINEYVFEARKGQRLVFSTLARQLVPFIADAVPGWFQPVLALRGPDGKEVAYDDDYQFNPDPTLLFEVPADGQYRLSVYDAIYRGREDFVYRITMGELPFVTSVYPLAVREGAPSSVSLAGWNLPRNAAPEIVELPTGVCLVSAKRDKLVSNVRPLVKSEVMDTSEKENNDTLGSAQSVCLPAFINGRIQDPGDLDLFKFTGTSNQTLVAEVLARRTGSPLDSVIKITDAKGKVIAFNDDREDRFAGSNTHDADSYLSVTLPTDGTYFLHLTDNAKNGGPEYAYRLRIGAPVPDFSLRVVPSSLSILRKGSASADVHIVRKDGFTGPVKIALRNPPAGFAANPVTISGTQTVARISIRTTLVHTEEPADLSVAGTATINGAEVVHEALAADDRMQAFFWRHLVPATTLKAVVVTPALDAVLTRKPLPDPAAMASSLKITNAPSAGKQQFTKQQVAGRLRQLRSLYQSGLLTDEFYCLKVLECEAVEKE